MTRKRKALTVQAEKKKDKKKKIEQRADPEFSANELAKKNVSRREQRLDPEYLAQERTHDYATRQSRRSNPETAAQERSRDNSTRRTHRSDPEAASLERSRDHSTRQTRRSDPIYLANESERDGLAQQQRRDDPDYSAQQLLRDNSTRQIRRSDPEYLRNESIRDKTSQQIRRKTRVSYDEAFETFKANIKDGPFHRCYSCDKLLFKTQVITTNRDKLKKNTKITDEYLALLILTELINDAEFTFCTTCMTYIRKATFPRFNINHSNLRFPDVPDVVKNLSPLAERCVAARIPFMKIVQVSFDKQLKIKSGVVNVPINVRKTVEAIPQPPEESGIIEVSLMRRMEYRNAYLKERIRPAEIWEAARLLCDTPLYKQENITLNIAMDPNIIAPNDVDMEIPETNQQEAGPSQVQAPNESELNDRHLPEETMLDSSEGETPIPMFMDPFCEELAFPTIWFGHPRGKPPSSVRLSFLDHINSEIRRFDRRACRPDHILFLHKKAQLEQLSKQVNIVLRKSANNRNITASQVMNKQFLENAVNNDSAYKFMTAITGSPAYFEAQKKKVLAMVRQNSGFTFFITFSAAETHWSELLVILKKTVDKIEISEDEAKQMTFEEKARLISSDPVTCAQYFYYRLKEVWKLMRSEDGPFVKFAITRTYCRIEFQHRGSPHAHQFFDLKDAPQFDPEDPESCDRVTAFVDQIITTDSDDPDVADIIYVQRHKCTSTCRKGRKGKEYCRFNAPFLPINRTTILEPISMSEGLSDTKLAQLKEISKLLHDTLESNAANIRTFDELLEILDCTFDDYILAARSTLKMRKLFVKREPKNCRINAYNKKLLIAMRSNMDIQFVLDIYSCVSYVVDYVNKADKGLSRLMRQCVEDHKRGNSNVKNVLKALSKILYNSSETSAQEAAWIRSRLPMCMATDVVEFINSGPKATRQCMLKSNAQLEKLARTNPDSIDIYKKGPIDRYADRPNELENICLADFIAKYNYHAKGSHATDDNDDDANDNEELDIIDEDNGEEQATEKKEYKLKNNSGTIKLRRRPKIIRYVRFSRHIDEINYFREMCMLFLPWRNEDDEIENQDCAKKFQENEEVIKANYDKYHAISLDLEEITRQIQLERNAEDNEIEQGENAEIVDPDFQNVYDFEDNIVPNALVEMGLEAPGVDANVSKYQVPNLIRDDEYLELCDSLNTLQRDFLMHIISEFKQPSRLPVYYFVSGGAGVGKSRLINAIYQSIMRIYRSEPGPVDSNEILLVAYTGMAAHNIGGITAHSAFNLTANQGKTDVGMSPDRANTMACELQRLKLIIIDEISMLSAEYLNQISSNLKQAFRSPHEFAGRSVIVVGDFYQLRPIGGSFAFKSKNSQFRDSLTALCDNPQWRLFKLFELTEIMRQKDDHRFAQALTQVAVGRMTPEDIALFTSRSYPDENSLPLEARTILRLIAHNKDVDEFNTQRARQLVNGGAQKYTFNAIDSFIGTYTQSQKNKARHELESLDKKLTQNLPRQIDLVIGLRYMVSTNIDVSDGLFNGASGFLRFVEISNRKINAVYIEFDDETIGARARGSRFGIMRANKINMRWTPINTTKKAFYVCKGGAVQVCREQYPLLMAEAITVHKSQGRSEPKIVVDVRNFDRQKHYVAYSRATSLNGLFILGQFKPPKEIESNNEVNVEMLRLREDPLIPKYQSLRIVPDNAIQIVSHNVQSIRKHVTTLVADRVFANSHIIALQETWAIDNENYNLPDFEEISRNHFIGRPKGFGTINFCKFDIESRISDRIEIENGNANDHIELSAFKIDKQIAIINVYNNPASNIEQLKATLIEIKEYIDESEDVLLIGDFNYNLVRNNQLETFLDCEFGMALLSPREATTNAGTTIDGAFGRVTNYNVECFIYDSYTSHHKPIVIRIYKI
ncbi:hypothetical protein PVAND_003045 [Polypedilum vanderplanki]|uniref:ATP-dependent DNA helicase n=1 Tax=Polypedilum vanderplanki TaxID=319348 RepID=A0A9J6BUI6_POLVA|nr:hypothetical protein PVAND_003045 [Polypedilum vanderplanki]